MTKNELRELVKEIVDLALNCENVYDAADDVFELLEQRGIIYDEEIREQSRDVSETSEVQGR